MGGAKEDWLELRLAWSVVRSFTHTYKERERERESSGGHWSIS